MKLITALLLALGCAIHQGRAFEITVHGVYFTLQEPEDIPPTYTLASLSGDSVASHWAEAFVDWIQVPPFEDEFGNPEEHWEIVAGSERTVFYFNLSGDWAGRQVCLQRAGGQTNFVHFYFGGLSFNNSDFSGGSPAPAPSVTMLGNYFTIGRLVNGATEEYPPYVISTFSQGDPGWPDTTIDFLATRSRSLWRWSNLVSATDPRMETAMALDADHRLTLYKHVGYPGIVLDPIAGTIKINSQPVLTALTASTQFVGKTATGINLAQSGAVRTQAGLPPQLVLGSYNVMTPPPAGSSPAHDQRQGVLIVGIGSDTGTELRKNGLRILDDGTVLIWPKDDLPMHEDFKKGPIP